MLHSFLHFSNKPFPLPSFPSINFLLEYMSWILNQLQFESVWPCKARMERHTKENGYCYGGVHYLFRFEWASLLKLNADQSRPGKDYRCCDLGHVLRSHFGMWLEKQKQFEFWELANKKSVVNSPVLPNSPFMYKKNSNGALLCIYGCMFSLEGEFVSGSQHPMTRAITYQSEFVLNDCLKGFVSAVGFPSRNFKHVRWQHHKRTYVPVRISFIVHNL